VIFSTERVATLEAWKDRVRRFLVRDAEFPICRFRFDKVAVKFCPRCLPAAPDGPVFLRNETLDFPFLFTDEPQRYRLDATG
jgi:hypothetical protein